MNYHQSLMNFIINFFFLFASALALFLASLYAKFFLSFYSFFGAERYFIISLPIRLMAGMAGRRHIWTSLPRCTAILVGVSSKLLNS